jgi:hypothetical protein
VSVVLRGRMGDVITRWQPNYSSFSLESVIIQRGKFIVQSNLTSTTPSRHDFQEQK